MSQICDQLDGAQTRDLRPFRGGRYSDRMRGRPERSEAAPYYFTYIDQVSSDSVV